MLEGLIKVVFSIGAGFFAEWMLNHFITHSDNKIVKWFARILFIVVFLGLAFGSEAFS